MKKTKLTIVFNEPRQIIHELLINIKDYNYKIIERIEVCDYCGKETNHLNRDGECKACEFEDKNNDMTVGDLNGR